MRKRRWNRSLPVIMLMFLASLGAQSQTTPVNIKSAIEMALAHNYSLKADSLNQLAAAYQLNVAKASLLPQVNLNSRSEYNPAIATQMIPGNMIGQPAKEFVPVQFGTRYSMGSGVDVNYNLVRKDLHHQVKAAGLNIGIAKTRYRMSREELVYQVALTFYSLQTNAELIRSTSHDYENLAQIVKIAKAQFENSVIKRIDYESLQINAANKKSYLNQLQTDYNDQLAYFNYLLGLPAETATVIDDQLPSVVQYTDHDKGLLQRSDLHLTSLLIQQKQEELKGIHAEKLPSVSTFFRFNYQAQVNEPGDAIRNMDYWYKSSTFGITTSLSIFDGRRRKSRINVARTELDQLRFSQEYQQQLAKTEQVRAWESFNNDNRQYQITQSNLALAEKVFDSRMALYTEGVTSLIELLDAEKELSQSRNLHIQAMVSVQTSLVNIHKSNGTLLTEFINSL